MKKTDNPSPTGRFASREPNFQQTPTVTEEARQIMEAFLKQHETLFNKAEARAQELDKLNEKLAAQINSLIEERKNLKFELLNPQDPVPAQGLKAMSERLQESWQNTVLLFDFKVGDIVRKSKGEALWSGVVVARYLTSKGKERYVVEVFPQGFQMIAVDSQLERVEDAD